MTFVAIVAIVDVVLIVLAGGIALASKVGQSRECRRLRAVTGVVMPAVGVGQGSEQAAPSSRAA